MWNKKKLGELCLIKSGDSNARDADDNGKYALFDRSKKIKKSKRFLFDCEALIIPGEGKEFLPRYYKGKFDLHQRAYAIHQFKPELNIQYLFYYLVYNKNYFSKVAVGATVKSLRQRHFDNLEIYYPSPSEQQRIVAKLDAAFAEIDKAILLKKKINDELIQLNSSIFLKLINGPKIKLGDLYEITSSKRVFKSEWKKKGVPFYRAREIVKLANNKPFKNPLYISEEMYSSYSKKYGAPKEGEILITGVGTLGITYVVKKNDKFYFKDGNIIWLKKKNSSINSNYIEYAFKSPFVKAQILNSIGATVGTLTIQKAKTLLIPYPSLEIQNEIKNKINKIHSNIYNCENLTKKILNNYTYLKNSILKRYLENKVA
mgnify:CR=1 FL=1